MEVTPCLVTRGDVDLDLILASFPKHWHDPIVYDNSVEPDLAVYGRYAAILRAQTDVVYVQDDDCVLTPWAIAELTARYRPRTLTANMPEAFRQYYDDSCLVGFGAIFDTTLAGPIHERVMGLVPTDVFRRTCDVYFTALVGRMEWVDVQYANLPWATADNRMYRQNTHVGERAKALEHARSLR